jgi:hypothetical protein
LRASEKNWKLSLRLINSTASSEDRRTWTHAFIILFIVSVLILTARLLGKQFLATDFEVVVVYFPTALAGLAALYVTMKSRSP